MADSISPVPLTTLWMDLYAASGIAPGTPLLVMATGTAGDVRIAISATEPVDEVGARIPFNKQSSIDGSQSGVWARASGGNATLLVQADSGGAARLLPFSDSRVIDGTKAFTTQPYTELNIKKGSQFYARVAYPLADPIGAGLTRKLYFTTGTPTVLVKDRMLHYIGEEFEINIYANPTGVTGGTPITISNWNLKNPNVTTVSGTKDVTTTTDGTLIQDPEFFYGAGATGQRTPDSIPEGYERVIAPNSDILVTITNNGANPARCQYTLSWYEGEISTEIP